MYQHTALMAGTRVSVGAVFTQATYTAPLQYALGGRSEAPEEQPCTPLTPAAEHLVRLYGLQCAGNPITEKSAHPVLAKATTMMALAHFRKTPAVPKTDANGLGFTETTIPIGSKGALMRLMVYPSGKNVIKVVIDGKYADSQVRKGARFTESYTRFYTAREQSKPFYPCDPNVVKRVIGKLVYPHNGCARTNSGYIEAMPLPPGM